MTSSSDGDQPISGSPPADEALSILGNETRLSVLQALWRERVPGHSTFEDALTFTELYDSIEYDDPGNLGYHLDQLVGPYIRQTEEGYSLRPQGLKVIQTVIAGTLTADQSIESIPSNISCRHCGADTVLTYESGMLFVCCTSDCEGTLEFREYPTGTVSAYILPPAALSNRNGEDILTAATVGRYTRLVSRLVGVCPVCSGQVRTQSFEACSDHATDGTSPRVCRSCGRAEKTRLIHSCEHCKGGGLVPGWMAIMINPQVMAFYDDHGIDVRAAPRSQLAETIEFERVVSTDPLEVQVEVVVADDQLTVTLDGDAAVVEVRFQ